MFTILSFYFFKLSTSAHVLRTKYSISIKFEFSKKKLIKILPLLILCSHPNNSMQTPLIYRSNQREQIKVDKSVLEIQEYGNSGIRLASS